MLEDHYLDNLFNPKSIAIIGASERAGSVGKKVMSNMLASQFPGALFPVNVKHKKVLDKPCFASVKDIHDRVDLAVITTPAATVPGIIKECGEKGIHSAIIISAGFSEMGEQGKELEQASLAAARQHNIHFIGPNCLGVMRPHSQLNATFDNNFALPGHVALISQSGAICAAVLDWAMDKEIGFSTIVSMGNSIDLDFGDILDYLAFDPLTKSILLYIEGVHYPRRFISGLRAAARVKPVIAIKAGRHATGVRAVHSHTGALVGDDDVFSAALDRAGVVRVTSIEQLFTAAQVLSSSYRAKGNRLAVITNGGGAGVMAADRASDLNVELAPLDDQILTELNQVLPVHWSHQNPMDILGDATPERYRAVVDIGMKDKNSDALLTILVPIAMTKPYEVAKEMVAFASRMDKPLLTCWMGEKQVKTSWKLFAENKIPCYSTPEMAVEAFSYLADYYQNQKLLLQAPAPFLSGSSDDIVGAESIIEAALSQQRKVLTTMESKAILNAFGIPVSETIEAHSEEEALVIAESLGFPVVMKISSPDITHKQDVDGVQLNLQDAEAVRLAFKKIMASVKAIKPDAKISGVTIEPMYKNPNYRELMIGVLRDKVFGPVIVFGMGGSLVEVIRDRAVSLPPLNAFLAEQLIAKTRARKLLTEFRGKPAVDMKALVRILQRVSDLVSELPQIQEMDINPLLIDENGAIAVDVRFVVDDVSTSRADYAHMAIHPYPKQWITHWQTADGVLITIRPICPEDGYKHEIKELTPDVWRRFTQIDYESEMAFVATMMQNENEMIVGLARYYTQSNKDACEFTLIVADPWQKKGIGSHLMTALMDSARAKSIKTMSGRILAENKEMLELLATLQFSIRPGEAGNMKIATKELGLEFA